MTNFKNHISFSSGVDIYQICKPFLDIFKFKHFTFCRSYCDGSRAILTTTTESLYDLYNNKKYIFSKNYKKNPNMFNLLVKKNMGYYFQSEFLNDIPDKFVTLKKLGLQQAHYEMTKQNIADRFSLVIKNEKYHEVFIFFIPQGHYSKYVYINNLELFHHFRLYFLDRAQKLICRAENNKLLQPINSPHDIFIIPSNVEKILEQMKINRFYLNGSKNYLTKQEMLCATYLINGYTAKQIAKVINLSPRTVETYIEKIREKISSSDRSILIEQLQLAFPSLQTITHCN